MSQFDQLLDFGEPQSPETNGTSSNTGINDDFDPFGPSSTKEGKGATESNLLVDFSVDTEVSNGKPQNGTADSFNLNFEEKATDSSSPLFEMTSESSSKTIFIDSGDSTNPLYEFTTKTETSSTLESSYTDSQENTTQDSSANPLYELSNSADIHDESSVMEPTVETSTTSASANPLYDLMGNGDDHHFDEDNMVTVTSEKIIEDGDMIITETTTVTESKPPEYEVSSDHEDEYTATTTTTTTVKETAEYEDEVKPDSDDEFVHIDYEETNAQTKYDNGTVQHHGVDIKIDGEDVAQEKDRFERSRSPSRSCSRSPTHSVDHTRSPSMTDEEEFVEKKEEVEEKQETVEAVKEEVEVEKEEVEVAKEEVEVAKEEVEVAKEEVEVAKEEVEVAKEEVEVEKQEVEKPKEEEEIVQDGETVFRTKEEKRYSDSFTNQNKFDAKQDYSTPHYLSNEQVQQHGQYNQNITNNEVSQEYYQFESSKDVTDYPTHTDEQEEGIYENEPMKRSDVVRESDTNIAEGLPAVGMAKNLLNKFAHIKDEPQEPRKKEITPPESVHGPVEYVSEPRAMVETYQGRPEAGIFENQPDYNPDVVRSGGAPEDILPEHGMARNVASKFKELEKTGGSTTKSAGKREITPDRDGGKVEFVSEPRGYVEKYEGRADSGVFENQPGHIDNVIKSGQEIEEELPEQGYAKNIASKFKQMERGVVPAPSQPRKKEMTPDRSTKVEYVSEPRGYVETYEGRAEAGVFENQPYSPTTEIVKCDQPVSEEPLPERGYAQHIAAKFRELETQAKSPPPTPVRIKEMTPPREEVNITQNSGVFESQPQVLPDVVRAEDNPEDVVPETGLAKSLVSRFKQLEAESSKPIVSAKQKREITPPKAESGVFENQPKQFVPEYNRQPESGILENKPEHKEGVIKESDPPKFEEELPERGMAKNLVSRWKQMENQGNTKVASPKPVKEFTPPREEERVKAARSPKSPKSPEVVQQEPTVFESEPGMRPDVYREADTDWMEGMPKSNTTKKMLEKFKHIQEEVNKQPTKPVSKKAKKTGFLVAVQTEKCGVCGKSVYAMERLEMNKVVYHKTCFKCSQCKSTLTPKTFAVNNGIMYCTNHYKQLFTRKGNYDEGFGREQHKKKWRSEPNLNDSEQQAT